MLNKSLDTQKEKQKAAQEQIKAAKNRFHKSFKEQFKRIYFLSHFGRFFFPIFSVGLGLTFISYLINTSIGNLYISFAVAFVLLAVWELAKADFLINLLEIYFSNKGIAWVLLVVTFVFQASSFSISILGARELYERTDKKTAQIQDFYKIQSDSITAKFNVAIDRNEKEISELKQKARGQWNGINTPEQNNIINQLRETNERTEASKQKALDELKTERSTVTNEATKKAGFNIVLFMIISFFIECLICLSGSFVIYYDMRIEKDCQEIEAEIFEPISVHASQLTKLMNHWGMFIGNLVEQGNLQESFQTTKQEKFLPINQTEVKEAVQEKRKAGFVFGQTPIAKKAENVHTNVHTDMHTKNAVSTVYTGHSEDSILNSIRKLEDHRKIVFVLKNELPEKAENITNEILRDRILPNLRNVKFKSPALIRNIYDIMVGVGIDRINIDENGAITILK